MKITKEQWGIIKNTCKECGHFWESNSRENNLLCDPAYAFETYAVNLDDWRSFLEGKNNCWCKCAIMPMYDEE